MLKKFSVTNFRGFANKIEWDLANPSNYEFSQYAIKDGLIKNAIIYGTNGSGKSNFSLAVFDIVNHLMQTEIQPDYYLNFPHAGTEDTPVVFEYTFKFYKDDIYYTYSKDKIGNLLSEKLYVNSKLIFEKTDSSLKINDFDLTKDAQSKFLSNSANQVSVISFLLSNVPLPENHYLILLDRFVDSMFWFGCLDSPLNIGLKRYVTLLDEYIIENGYLEKFATFLKDISGQQFDFSLTKEGDKHILCKIDDVSIPFNLLNSTGTKSLELLFYWITNMMKGASLVFIDDFDAFLHFKLAFEVCKQLFSLEDCQVFLTSHNTYLMTNDLLRPDCNFILDNNKIKPLNLCTDKELRLEHNIEKLFRGNTFKV